MVPQLLPAVAAARRRFIARAIAAGVAPVAPCFAAGARSGRVIDADPGSYRDALRGLRPGDTLRLAAGEYVRGLPLHGLIGADARPIAIEGPGAGARAVFAARPGANTVSIVESAFVEVRNLRLDGRELPVDAVKAEGHSAWAHHITLEGLQIVNHGASQQTVGISTKCAAWGWIVRGNTIVGAGTGMYFGDSDGSDPFWDSLIEGNRIVDPLGYGMQVKHQHGRPAAEANGKAGATVIRHNVIVKGRVAASAELARPSLLVGHWPLRGPGANDRYLIHGNLLFDNPSEALLQGEGNIALYNNLLFNPRGDGVRIQPHNHRPREVAVFNNTIIAAALGVGFGGVEPGYARLFEHNLVYGNPPIESEVSGENARGDYDRARSAFVDLSMDPARLDLTPRHGLVAPQSRIEEIWLALPGAQHDYRGRPRGGEIFGACSRAAALRCGL